MIIKSRLLNQEFSLQIDRSADTGHFTQLIGLTEDSFLKEH